MATTLKGLVYVKLGLVGTRSEGPDYWLQTSQGDYQLRYDKRAHWEPDYRLEFHGRQMVEVKGELDDSGKVLAVEAISQILSGLLPPGEAYDAQRGMLVLSADAVGGFVAPALLVNHVPATRIYGDGKVVFVDPSVGSSQIHEGTMTSEQIGGLIRLLRDKGFFGFTASYASNAGADMSTDIVTARLAGGPVKQVGCYGGELSAPPGFMECYRALLYPQIQPANVQTYVRQPITDAEIETGWYYGFEYQKKLNTPNDWVWVEEGRSSQWRRPILARRGLGFDSGYMATPLDGCHHVAIQYSGQQPDTGSSIQFDRNAMSPTPYGDIGISTKMFFTPRPATFKLLQQEAQKQLLAVECTGYEGPPLRLVVLGDPQRPSGARLLVLDDHGAPQGIYHLDPR